MATQSVPSAGTRVARHQAIRVDPGGGHPVHPVPRLGAGGVDRVGRVLVLRAAVRLRSHPRARPDLGLDRNNPPDEVIEALENDRYYRWVTYLFIPAQYVCIAWTFWMVTRPATTSPTQVGMAISLGMVAGIAINTAHELGHKKETHERWYARIALAQTFYGHFYIEHNRGHHVRVATPEDPASSKLGENIYQFLPRTMWGSLRARGISRPSG